MRTPRKATLLPQPQLLSLHFYPVWVLLFCRRAAASGRTHGLVFLQVRCTAIPKSSRMSTFRSVAHRSDSRQRKTPHPRFREPPNSPAPELPKEWFCYTNYLVRNIKMQLYVPSSSLRLGGPTEIRVFLSREEVGDPVACLPFAVGRSPVSFKAAAFAV